jgi:hypothetical protein
MLPDAEGVRGVVWSWFGFGVWAWGALRVGWFFFFFKFERAVWIAFSVLLVLAN